MHDLETLWNYFAREGTQLDSLNLTVTEVGLLSDFHVTRAKFTDYWLTVWLINSFIINWFIIILTRSYLPSRDQVQRQ